MNDSATLPMPPSQWLLWASTGRAGNSHRALALWPLLHLAPARRTYRCCAARPGGQRR